VIFKNGAVGGQSLHLPKRIFNYPLIRTICKEKHSTEISYEQVEAGRTAYFY
jgi:hypothetical protein